jgi:2-isopropylmalate synthase
VHCNRLPIHPRHPYVGDLVFTAFSGSHQDAIKKGFASLRQARSDAWEVPYLPIDPADIGRSYDAIIRINSQSGKGGIAYVMEEDYGLRLPRKLQIEFSRSIQKITDESGLELPPSAVWDAFDRQYLSARGKYALVDYELTESNKGHRITVRITDGDASRELVGAGNGPIDAFVAALKQMSGLELRVSDYSEHALGEGADARAIAYVEVALPGRAAYGVAIDQSIVNASLLAVVGAVNRLLDPSQRSLAAE